MTIENFQNIHTWGYLQVCKCIQISLFFLAPTYKLFIFYVSLFSNTYSYKISEKVDMHGITPSTLAWPKIWMPQSMYVDLGFHSYAALWKRIFCGCLKQKLSCYVGTVLFKSLMQYRRCHLTLCVITLCQAI